MKTTASQRVRIGVFTAAGILILLAGIYIIGKKKNMFGNTFHIYGNFNNVGGLREGNNVRFAGINVGTVQDITIVSDSTIRVDMILQSKIKPFLKSTSFASIGSDGLMGDKLVTITAGEASDMLLTKDGKIVTHNPVDFDKSIAKITSIVSNAEVISGELAGIAVNLKQGKGSIGRLFYNGDLAKSLEGTAKNAQNITQSFADIAGTIKSGEGSLGRLVYTDSLAKSLEGTAAGAKVTMATINDAAYGFSENMKALQSSFLFRGYFKRKAKAKAKEKAAAENENVSDSADFEMSEADLIEIEAAADKAQQAIIERKKKEKSKPVSRVSEQPAIKD